MNSHRSWDPWHAPAPGVPVRATVPIPGSKSLTARHLVIAAMAAEPSTISGALLSRDTTLMIDALRKLGTSIDHDGTTLHITPRPFGPAHIDVGLAGTVLRFLVAAAATARGDVTFDGDAGMRRRPLTPLVNALTELGVSISSPDSGDSLPLTVHGPAEFTQTTVSVDASESSQFLSALLLVAPHLPQGLEIQHVGNALPSLPHIEMTCRVLDQAGVRIEHAPGTATWRVHGGPVRPGNVTVEPDLSNAAPFLAAAMVTGGEVAIPHWPSVTMQAGNRVPEIFEQLGATVTRDGSTLTLTGPERFDGIDIDLQDAGEVAPTIAAVLAFADTPSRLRGIGHLRGHETDRLSAIATELTNLGGDVTEQPDGLTITPRPLTAGTMSTYHDHRMATFAAIIGLRTPGTLVENIATTSKTLPDFTGMWEAMTNPEEHR